jgi:putative addiction module killer protein
VVSYGIVCVTILTIVELREYWERSGRNPFREWFDRLNSEAARKVTTALYRMALGNLSNVKSVGEGVQERRIHFGPGYRVYFGRDGESSSCWPVERNRGSNPTFARQSRVGKITKGGRGRKENEMALTKNFRKSVQARVKRDPAFREGMLREAIESLLSGELALGKNILRDYINATVGFPRLAAKTKIPVKSAHRMFGPRGNPTARNLFQIVAFLQHSEGMQLEVRPTRGWRRAVRKKRKRGAIAARGRQSALKRGPSTPGR